MVHWLFRYAKFSIKQGLLSAFLLWMLLLVSGCTLDETSENEVAAGSAPRATVVADPAGLPILVWQGGSGLAHAALMDRAGRTLALGTTAGLFLYDAQSWQPLGRWGPAEAVYSMAFSENGRFLAFVPLNSNQVELWDVAAGTRLHSFAIDEAPIRHLVFAPSGQMLGAASFDEIHIWNLSDGHLLSQITPDDGSRIRDLIFSPDGSKVVSSLISDGPGRIALWQAADGSSAGFYQDTNAAWLANPRFSPGGQWLAAEFGGTTTTAVNPQGLLLWPVGQLKTAREYSLPGDLLPGAWGFSADSQQLAAGYQDGRVAIWPTGAEAAVTILPGVGDVPLASLTFDPVGDVLTIVFADGTLNNHSLADGRLTASLQLNDVPYGPLFLQASRSADLLALGSSGQVRVWDKDKGGLKARIDDHLDGAVNSLAFSPDSSALAVGMANGQVAFIETESGAALSALPDHFGAVDTIAFAPDGARLATGVGERVSSLAFDDTLRFWSWPGGDLIHEIAGEQEEIVGCSAFQNQAAFTGDGALLAATSHDFNVELWRVADGVLERALSGHEAPVLDLALSPDGSTLASASEDGTIRLWRVADGQPLHILSSPAFGWGAVAYAPDGRTLAGATAAGAIILWDALSGEQLRVIDGLANQRSDLVFSADGSWLAAGADGSAVHLWHTASGELAGVLAGPGGMVQSLAFSPDGRYLAAGDKQGMVTLWRMPG